MNSAARAKAKKATQKRATGKKSKKTGAGSRRRAGPTSLNKSFDSLLKTRGTVTDSLKMVRFAGISLGGGKTDKTAVAVIEYFPNQKRIFLRTLKDKLSGKDGATADEALYALLNDEETDLSSVAFDVPLQLPKCFRCELRCPGVENCIQPEVKWMRNVHKGRAKEKRPNKMFTPYTERAAEIFIANKLEEPFHPPHAMGSNAAPLTARARFLQRRLAVPMMEVYPKLSLWRIGMALDIPKSYLRFHRHAVDSDEARHYILRSLIEKEIAFVYQQDLRMMVENSIAFDAFICALTAFLKFRDQTEKRPSDFPKEEIWIDFPRQKIQWF
jgi:hypothetical protein